MIDSILYETFKYIQNLFVTTNRKQEQILMYFSQLMDQLIG